MTDSVLTETHGRVGLIRFNRPEGDECAERRRGGGAGRRHR